MHCDFFKSNPFLAAIDVERATTNGIAKPNAWGQAMMKTVTMRSNALGRSVKNNHAINANIPAINAI